VGEGALELQRGNALPEPAVTGQSVPYRGNSGGTTDFIKFALSQKARGVFYFVFTE